MANMNQFLSSDPSPTIMPVNIKKMVLAQSIARRNRVCFSFFSTLGGFLYFVGWVFEGLLGAFFLFLTQIGSRR